MTSSVQQQGEYGAYSLHGQAMGTRVDIQTSGSYDLAEDGLERIVELEHRWSRFLPDSDISRCNATRGIPVLVHPDTRRLVQHAVRAWERTNGALDPTVLDALIAAGYDRPFNQLDPQAVTSRASPGRAPGCADIEVDDNLGTVTLPRDVGFDPGAIGKGLAADMVVEELLDAGASGAFVSIGGDIRLDGAAEAGDGWLIEIREARVRADVIARVSMTGGGLATSTNRRRRWTTAGEDRHHIIDPTTGRCASTEVVLVTAIAGETWWAEALATQLMLSAPERWSTVVGDDGALVVDRSGTIHVLGRMGEHLR